MLFCPLPLVILLAASSCKAEYLDRWNYYGTEQRKDDHFDFGPEDWQDIVCDETNGETLDQCLAYIDKWHTGRGWKIEDNYCLWCPEGGNDCGIHHQSPIDLLRDGAIEGHENENECLDLHWMKYEDSFCTEDQLIAADAFTVERHALRVSQPITVFEDQELQIDCENSDGKRRFGRIDFSTGFSQWWYLSHIDFHTPSEHTQEGKRYDGEIQLVSSSSLMSISPNRSAGGVK